MNDLSPTVRPPDVHYADTPQRRTGDGLQHPAVGGSKNPVSLNSYRKGKPMKMDLKCPRCGTRIARHTCPADFDAVPRPGDVTVCAHCLAAMEFTEDGLKSADLESLDPNTRRTLETVRELIELNSQRSISG